MIRRLGTALIGLALILPVMALPVAANHGTTAVIVNTSSTYISGADVHVVGTVINNDNERRTNINVTATLKNGADVTVGTPSALAYLTSLAPHAVTPFHISVPTPVGTDTTKTTVAVTSQALATQPNGGLDIEGAALDLVLDTVSGDVINESAVSGDAVTVYAALFRGTTVVDTAASGSVGTLAPAGSAPYTISFDQDALAGDTVLTVARTTSGSAVLVSWNDYFSDIGASEFGEEIAFLADEGITLGCGPARFCPTSSVTREEMAAFLDRALGLTDAPLDPYPFTDVDETSFAYQAIADVAAAEITLGCGDGTTYCPDDKVTRVQMAAFIDRAYGLAGGSGDHFTDDEDVFAGGEASIEDLFANGVTLGCTATLYCPDANVTREQMAAFLFRAETP